MPCRLGRCEKARSQFLVCTVILVGVAGLVGSAPTDGSSSNRLCNTLAAERHADASSHVAFLQCSVLVAGRFAVFNFDSAMKTTLGMEFKDGPPVAQQISIGQEPTAQ